MGNLCVLKKNPLISVDENIIQGVHMGYVVTRCPSYSSEMRSK